MGGDLKHSARRADGYVLVTGPDGTFEGECLQCRHCNCQWVIRPGSGRERGWCFHCGGPICGVEVCFTCVPFEKKLEFWEGKGAVILS